MSLFDPGINILPPFFLTGATLSVPESRQAPTAADAFMRGARRTVEAFTD